jgi:hypothetical protein
MSVEPSIPRRPVATSMIGRKRGVNPLDGAAPDGWETLAGGIPGIRYLSQVTEAV